MASSSRRSKATTAVLLMLLAFAMTLAPRAAGHGLLISPPGRQFSAYQDGQNGQKTPGQIYRFPEVSPSSVCMKGWGGSKPVRMRRSFGNLTRATHNFISTARIA